MRPLLLSSVVLLSLGSVAVATPAFAQSSIFEVPVEKAETYIDVGAAVLSRPAYLGSNNQDVNIFPYLAGEYKGRLFFDPARGAGVHAINTEKLQVSAFATLATSRDAEDTGVFNDLVSIGAFEDDAALAAAEDALEVKASVLASASARYRFKYALGEISVATPVTGDVEGFRSEVSLGTKIPVDLGGLNIFPGVRATYTSKDWNQTYYGVSAAQADATGLDTFDAGGDISVLSSFVLLTYDGLGDDIQVIGLANYNWLQGGLQDSVLTPDDQGLTAVLGVAKRF